MSVHLEELVVTSAGRPLVDVADIRLAPGRAGTIVGESGSGKSLLAHAVMGTLAPELEARGRLHLEHTRYDVADRSNRRHLWGRHLALLPQEPVLALDPTMRVGAQVAEGTPGFPSDRRSARSRAAELLAALGLGDRAQAYPHTLSGGMAQRVAFAAATIGGARVLIADEPSKGLDDAARDALAVLLRRHLEGGGVLLTITHDLDLARRLGGDVLVMRDAAVVERGPAEAVLDRPASAYTRRLLAAEPGRWRPPGTRRDAGPTAPDRDGAPVLVAADRVTKGFGRRSVFTDVSLTVRAGDRVALTGPSGSGKTTLGSVLLRLLPPDSGSVRHAPQLAHGRLQKLYQDPAVAFPARVPIGTGLRDLLRRHRPEPGRLGTLMTSMRLDAALLRRRPGQVSGGELQRLAIIRAMLLDPLLVFADEPTSRLDLVTQAETVRCLVEQLDRAGCGLVLVTHDRALAGAVCDREVSLAAEPTVPLGHG